MVEVGRENFQAHAVALVYEDGDFIGVVDLVGKEGGHELDGVVCLHVGGPVRDVAVAGGVGFVEAVSGEHLDFVEDGAREFLADVVRFLTALDETGAFLRHLLLVLFSHGAAEQVGLAEGVSGEEFGGVLHLLLVDHDAVGVAANSL